MSGEKCHHCEWLPWETTAWLVWGVLILLLAMIIATNLTTPAGP